MTSVIVNNHNHKLTITNDKPKWLSRDQFLVLQELMWLDPIWWLHNVELYDFKYVIIRMDSRTGAALISSDADEEENVIYITNIEKM